MTSTFTVKRIVLSAVVAMISGGTIAPNAFALPKSDPSFDLLELRHREQDIREGIVRPESTPAGPAAGDSYSDESDEANYGAAYEPVAESAQTIEADEPQEPLSLVEQRRQAAAQRNK